MIAAIKAEYRKLITTRAVWLLALVMFLLGAGLIGFWIYGFKNVNHAESAAMTLQSVILAVVSVASIFVSFIAVLLFGHEYRYLTIMYSLTSANRRSKVFFAKLLVSILASLVLTAFVMAAAVGTFYIGQHLHHVHTIPQHIEVASVLWRSVAEIAGSVIFAFIIVALLRNLIGAIAIILVLPTTIENLLALLLKENVKYLPYTALGNFTNESPVHGSSYLNSLAIVAAYVVVGGLVSYILFLKRDAN